MTASTVVTPPTAMAARMGVVYICLSALGYAFFPIWAHYLSQSLGSLEIVFWRLSITAPTFWLLHTLRRRLGTGAPDAAQRPLPWRRLLAVGVLLAIASFTGFEGLRILPASIYITLFYTYPAMVALIAVARGERLPLVAWVALVLTLVGVVLTLPELANVFTTGFDALLVRGVGLALFNAFAVALYFVVVGRIGSADALGVSAWTMTGALLCTALTLFVQPPRLPDAATLLLLVGLALVSTVLPYFMLNMGIRRLGAPRAAIISTVEPPLTILLAVIMLGDVLLPVQILGAAVIIGSVILLQLRG